MEVAKAEKEPFNQNKLENWKTLSKTELPEWLQNNNFILNGYRPQLKSYHLCVLSWFRLHTETGNIWTHLIAFIASLAYLAYYMSLTIGADIEFEIFFILFYFAAAINCWLFSVCFHTFRCHSPRVLRRSECLDYFGILVFAVSAFLPVIYFLFRCDTLWRYIYLGALLILSIGILFLISWEPFSKDKYRIYKVIAFSSLSLCLFLPLIHASLQFGMEEILGIDALQALINFCIAASIAIIIYLAQFPERIMPGKFDIWGHSHQLFHIVTAIGGWLQLQAIFEMQQYASQTDCNNILLQNTTEILHNR